MFIRIWKEVDAYNFDDAQVISGESDAEFLKNLISYLYLVENESILHERTSEEIKKRRCEKDVTDTLIYLHSLAEKLLRK